MANKKPLNANAKGKKFERTIANKLTELTGKNWSRNFQFRGNNKGNPDISCDGSILHVECKRQESFSLPRTMDQVFGECGKNIPVIVQKYSGKKAMIMFPFDELVPFVAHMRDELSHKASDCPDVKGWCPMCTE